MIADRMGVYQIVLYFNDQQKMMLEGCKLGCESGFEK